MQKVVTINLNGTAYQLDESAYDRLRAYLDGAASKLADNPDRAEILADFEQAIAEKCRRHLGPQKSVVTSADMDAVLTEMGPVDGDAQTTGDTEQSGTAGPGASGAAAEPSTPAGERPPKRLYRLRGPGGIAGVCAGLAAFLGIRVGIIRVLFILFAALTQGFGIIVYLILTFLVPEAHTSDERAAAYGERFDAQSVVDEARRHATDIGNDLRESGAEWRKAWGKERRHWQVQQRAWRREWRAQSARPYAPPAWAPVSIGGQPSPTWATLVVIVFAFLSMTSVAVLIAAIASLLNTGLIYGWAPPPAVPMWATILVLIALFQLVNSPLRAARYASYNAWGPRSALAVWDGILAAALAFLVIWLLYRHMPPVEDFDDFMRALPDAFRGLVQEVGGWIHTVFGSAGRQT